MGRRVERQKGRGVGRGIRGRQILVVGIEKGSISMLDLKRAQMKIHYVHFTFLDIDECSCDPNADCINTGSSYICQCRQGFTGNGMACTGMTP